MRGPAFDKAYAENELAYDQTVRTALEKTLIPSAKNDELRNLLYACYKAYKTQEDQAERLVSELK